MCQGSSHFTFFCIFLYLQNSRSSIRVKCFGQSIQCRKRHPHYSSVHLHSPEWSHDRTHSRLLVRTSLISNSLNFPSTAIWGWAKEEALQGRVRRQRRIKHILNKLRNPGAHFCWLIEEINLELAQPLLCGWFLTAKSDVISHAFKCPADDWIYLCSVWMSNIINTGQGKKEVSEFFVRETY